MVIKFEDDDELYIIDATLAGVNVTPWRQVCTYKDQIYSKIVWRQLNIKRNDAFIDRLEKFVTSVHRKKYKLSVTKLLKR